MQMGDGVDVAVAGHQTRVGSFEEGVQRVAGVVSDLGKKIDAGQRTPWTMIWTALGVVVAFMGMIIVFLYRPVEINIDTLQTRVRDGREHLESRIDANAREITRLREVSISEDDLARRLDALDRIWRELRVVADVRSLAITAAIEDLRKSIVPRAEHDEKWRSEAAQVLNFQH
jgi:hypothetical protein